jgi:hypothetical protein
VVRLLTIHKAKGLQFKVVCLVNLGGRPQAPGPYLWKDGRLELRLGSQEAGLGTRGFEDAQEHEKRRQEAERIRLLYVAATRAEDLLVISRIGSPKQRSEELKLLEDHPGGGEVYPVSTPAPPPPQEEEEGSILRLVEKASRELSAGGERIRAAYRPAPSVRPSGAEVEEGEPAADPADAGGASACGAPPPPRGGPAPFGGAGGRVARRDCQVEPRLVMSLPAKSRSAPASIAELRSGPKRRDGA